MPQGPRRGWVRAVFAGLGVVVCAGAIGCTGLDKDKAPPKIGSNVMGKQQQPGPGLPGMQTLPGQPGSGLATTRTPLPGSNNPYAGYGMGAGAGVQQTGSWNTGAGAGNVRPPYSPGTGGAGSGFGTGAGAGTGTGFGPAPGVIPSAAPTGGLGTGNMPSSWGGANHPAAPSLSDVPMPPPPPGSAGAFGSTVTPPGPISPAAGAQTHNLGVGVFGDGR